MLTLMTLIRKKEMYFFIFIYSIYFDYINE
jgi:hypothetical protein